MPFSLTGIASTVLAFLVVLALLVLVHELGHFATAKLFRVAVQEFGVGFPPRLFGLRRGETLYSVNLLPLGGFVRLLGEQDPSHPRSLARQAPWKRFVILSAGSAMNLLLAVVLFAALFMVPQRVPAGEVVITHVLPDSPAAQAGLRAGDRIVSIEGEEVSFSGDVRRHVELGRGRATTWRLSRGGRPVEAELTPRAAPPPGQGPTGILLATARVRVEDVEPGSAAAALGLRSDDLLAWLVPRGVPVPSALDQVVALGSDDLAAAASRLRERGVEGVDLLVWRQGEVLRLPLAASPERVSAALGGARLATLPPVVESDPPWVALPEGATRVWRTLTLLRQEIGRWVRGTSEPEITGPIGIAQISGEVAQRGLLPLLGFAAFLSINLGILNILPIPMLDGGRLMFVVIEWARRGKRVSPEREGFVHLVGFMVLLSVILLVSYHDILRLVQGESALP